MNANEEIPEQNPPQPPKRPARKGTNQLTLFLKGGFGKKSDDERLLKLFDDIERGREEHPYGAGAR